MLQELRVAEQMWSAGSVSGGVEVLEGASVTEVARRFVSLGTRPPARCRRRSPGH